MRIVLQQNEDGRRSFAIETGQAPIPCADDTIVVVLGPVAAAFYHALAVL